MPAAFVVLEAASRVLYLKTGPEVELLLPGAGEFGKGSSTKTRLELGAAVFDAAPGEAPVGCEKRLGTTLLRVARGNRRRLVLVESEYCDTTPLTLRE